MTTGNVIANTGRKLILDRAFKVTPTYTAPTKFKVGTGTNTPAVTDTDLQTATITKDIVSGYPTIDETNFQVTWRSYLSTTEGNGTTLTEYGLFNNDATKLMLSRAVHTALSKTSDIQVFYIEKDKLS